jgi:cell division protease FtsH
MESWLPIGFELPDGARCGRALHEDSDWQIVETRGGGTALIAKEELFSKWLKFGLVDQGEFKLFTFGSVALREISCGASQILAPVADCRSPKNKNEALAFATAFRDTRTIDPDSPLQDAVYVEKFSRLLPSYGITSKTDDDIVVGYWLTGGAKVSAKSFRRLRQMLSWLGSRHLRDVIQTAGFAVSEVMPLDLGKAETAQKSESVGAQRSAKQDAPMDTNVATAEYKPFELPGRPELENFFNEYVIDIVRHKERYSALGVGFPSAMVLHGPPGCGKTFAVEQLVEYLGWPSFEIDASSVASPYIHETSKKVADVFEKAMQNAPSVLVIDEMEAFLADREIGSGTSHHRVEEVAEFLRRIPQAVANEVLIVAMTNRIEMIDTAIMRRGRFDHIIKVDYANADEVLALLEKLLATLPKDDTIRTAPLAKRLAGRPLSDVAFMVREGARLAARSGSSSLGQEFLLAAFNDTPSRTNEGLRRRIGIV